MVGYFFGLFFAAQFSLWPYFPSGVRRRCFHSCNKNKFDNHFFHHMFPSTMPADLLCLFFLFDRSTWHIPILPILCVYFLTILFRFFLLSNATMPMVFGIRVFFFSFTSLKTTLQHVCGLTVNCSL